MSITRTFEHLGIPLANPRGAWGGYGAGVIVLRCWQDQLREDPSAGNPRLLVINPRWHRLDSDGLSERIWHVGLIGAGAPAFAVLFRDRRDGAREFARSVVGSRNPPVWRCGEIFVDSEGTWVTLVERYPDISAARRAVALASRKAAA